MDENLELVSSTYNTDEWQMLDQEFDVRNINLISEELLEKESFMVASFVVKVINDEDLTATVSFENVLLGDENYVNHESEISSIKIMVEEEKIYLKISKSLPTFFDIFL